MARRPRPRNGSCTTWPSMCRPAGYDSCLGRAAHAFGVDGLYTKGMVGASAQLIYAPLYNAFNPSLPPLPSRLHLPGNLIADAIAAARNTDNSSDLYVAAGGRLYSCRRQPEGWRDRSAGRIEIRCSPPRDRCMRLPPTAPSLSGTQQQRPGILSPLSARPAGTVHRVDRAAADDDRRRCGLAIHRPWLQRQHFFRALRRQACSSSSNSPTTGLWSQRHITLPPSATTKPATPIHSYTTHVQVTDANGQAAANVSVKLTATNVISVYINHLYYIVGPSPIEVTTDVRGTVTIVEATTSLAGTRYQASIASQPAVAVNTMDTAWQRTANGTSVDSLTAAKIVNRDGSTRDFIPGGTSPADLQRVAYSNQSLAQSYNGLVNKPPPTMAQPVPRALAASRGDALAAQGFIDGILVGIGDLGPVAGDRHRGSGPPDRGCRRGRLAPRGGDRRGGLSRHPGLRESGRGGGHLDLQCHQDRGPGHHPVSRIPVRVAGHPGHPQGAQEPVPVPRQAGHRRESNDQGRCQPGVRAAGRPDRELGEHPGLHSDTRRHRRRHPPAAGQNSAPATPRHPSLPRWLRGQLEQSVAGRPGRSGVRRSDQPAGSGRRSARRRRGRDQDGHHRPVQQPQRQRRHQEVPGYRRRHGSEVRGERAGHAAGRVRPADGRHDPHPDRQAGHSYFVLAVQGAYSGRTVIPRRDLSDCGYPGHPHHRLPPARHRSRKATRSPRV